MVHILIVDDSPTEIHILKTMLERHGYRTSAARNGTEAIALARQEHPDVVLMDIVMPGVSGFQATRQLNKDPATSSIPVIVVTTKDQETDKVWALRQGARDYIVKPVIEQDLIAKIQAALAS
jgi:twitching motility two-component system response regulator PilH